MRRSQVYAGLITPLVAFTGIVTAAYINRSWWRLTENAISDLGKLGLPHNWILNLSLIATALLAIYYALGLLKLAENDVEKAGVWVFIFGLIFLAMIGLFPEGTTPHYYVSWAFFIVSAMGIAVTGVGFLLSGRERLGQLSEILVVVGASLALWAKAHYTGVAIAELIGALTIVTWHYAVLFSLINNVQ
jgi:hypothetical membrane protein